MLFQESKDRALATDFPKIVKSIENSAEVVVEKVKEAEREAEIRRQQWAEQLERSRQEEDRRRVAESIKESGEQLSRVIEDWARVRAWSTSSQELRSAFRVCRKVSDKKCGGVMRWLASLLGRKIRSISSVRGKHPLNDTYRCQWGNLKEWKTGVSSA